MFDLVPSECMRKYYEEIGFTFTDFQKATLIWNAPGKKRQEILEALSELAEVTDEERLKKQIDGRLPGINIYGGLKRKTYMLIILIHRLLYLNSMSPESGRMSI